MYDKGDIVQCVSNPFGESVLTLGHYYLVKGAERYEGEEVIALQNHRGEVIHVSNHPVQKLCGVADMDYDELVAEWEDYMLEEAEDILKYQKEVEPDMINPDHYKVGGIETIDFIRAKLTLEQYRGYLKGNIIKYLSREGHKGDIPEQDLQKAEWYIRKLLETFE